MKGKVIKEGTYEIFRTTKEHEILVLNEKEYYALVKGQKSLIIVKSDSDHKKDKTLKSGTFFYVDFKNDPEFNDIPHLFLEENKMYEEFILPNGFPDKNNTSKRLVIPEEKIPEIKFTKYIKQTTSNRKKDRSPISGKYKELESKTKDELYEMAKKQNIKNRSRMSKQELIENLKK
jgi:hypothetical protein